jgi:transposase-like protein
MGKKKTKYSLEFKLNAVSRMAHAKTIGGLAKELGARRRFLYKWRKKLAAGARAALGEEVSWTDGASWTHYRTLLRVDNDRARQ